MKRIVSLIIIITLSVAIIASGWILGVAFESSNKIDEYKESQIEYMVGIRERGTGNYEQRFFGQFTDFDLDQAYSDNVKYNDVQFLATHNSYKAKSTSVMYAATPFYFNKYTYYFDPLFEQLDKGIFSLELDIYPTSDGFLCMHKTYGDVATNAIDFALALEEIAVWSSINVGHLPLAIMIQPKDWTMRKSDSVDITDEGVFERLDTLLIDTFGDKIYSPSKMLGDTYNNLKEAASSDAWPTLFSLRNKVVIMCLTDSIYDYVDLDPTLKTQQMFPMIKMSLPEKYASYDVHRAFTLIDDTFNMSKQEITRKEKSGRAEYIVSDNIKQAKEGNVFIRTRIDMYEYYSTTAVPLVIAAGANILATDYPPHNNARTDYVIPLDKTVFLKQG
jgi:hypothetical protein